MSHVLLLFQRRWLLTDALLAGYVDQGHLVAVPSAVDARNAFLIGPAGWG